MPQSITTDSQGGAQIFSQSFFLVCPAAAASAPFARAQKCKSGGKNGPKVTLE
jgi:hypothetical protein